ncbi:MAG: TetR/AcrR family transcriptional regulator [bacterium]|nr:TetR/AcrR family transcriptional regulator [bacterium]
MKKEIKKADRRIGKTKQSIRDAFLSLLIEKPIAQITVKELAERANVNRKTFYMYYANIHDILDKTENEIIEQLLDLLKDCRFFDQDFDVYAFFLSLNGLIGEDFKLYQQLVYANSNTQFFVKVKQIMKSTIMQYYCDSFPINQEMFQLYTEFAASGIMAMYIEWFTINSTMTLEEMAKAAADITMQGFQMFIQKTSY